ncbi:Thiopurine S-methyltransferase [Pseudovibrio axinellae]|uniref:Thiopurine S-methyltransferase n=1 Tax=Pseudovibrio axinellae TaxID=989403 RepID=A0A161XCN9_9HYPH|nr:methyltransferase domain-containing protein [Pseudovibrio axinellae]KZL12508.1 Thiopurine S-methyltransferase [Pseudovibrio axinellae]SEP69206.1 Thiopurine S-methyltransferase (TPMT) [Pseudovibrio axinellae]
MSTQDMDHRKQLHERLDKLEGASDGSWESRKSWFEQVYTSANGDTNEIPWAELKPKEPLAKWLEANNGQGRTALDVGCGLGDNANALHMAGWKTSAFDVAPSAIKWATSRFPAGEVEFRCADLMNPPQDWVGKFDLVYECYTLQAVSSELRKSFVKPLKSLVAPGGTLIILTRYCEEDEDASGPPWPLTNSELSMFCDDNFEQSVRYTYTLHKEDGRTIPHIWLELKRKA